MTVSILIFIAILVFIILTHELGHFTTAKLSGVKVEEFGIGFPPRLLARKWGETEYSINLIPLGGFVRMAGEEDPSEPRSLAAKSRWVRLLVLSAGSLVNILLPILLLIIAFMIPMQVVTGGDVQVYEVVSGSPAEAAGLQVGDIIVSANGQPISNFDDLHEVISSNPDFPVAMVLDRGGSEVNVTVIPTTIDGEVRIGVTLELVNPQYITESHPVGEAIILGFTGTWDILVAIKDGVASLISGAEPFVLLGPVGIAQATSEVAQFGAAPVLRWAAIISMSIGILNLLPFPALDGGRIAFLLLEVVRRGKRLSPRTEGLINMIGFALLMVLVMVVSYYDILRIIHGEGIIP